MQYSPFYEKWQGRVITDTGSYNSSEAILFARDLKSALSAEFMKRNMRLIRYRIGHYYISGFVVLDNHYAYFSYDMPRGHLPVDLDDNGVNGFLYRTAESLSDFVGGHNHFSSLKDLAENIQRLITHS